VTLVLQVRRVTLVTLVLLVRVVLSRIHKPKIFVGLMERPHVQLGFRVLVVELFL
jgi:hypothetical protein